MDKKKREKSKQLVRRGPAKGGAQEDLELENDQAQRVKGGSFSFGASKISAKLPPD
jgi:hypothetical protein